MNISLRNRIALFYLSATSVITLLVFIVIYQVVYNASFDNLDERLEFEVIDIVDDMDLNRDSIFFFDDAEWTEKEHQEAEVYPIFAEVTDIDKNVVKRTPNLKSAALTLFPFSSGSDNFNSRLSDKQVRQTQRPILNKSGRLIGYVIVAIPLEGAAGVVANLRRVLIISFPILLIMLFFITRYIAGKSIGPLIKITQDAEEITKEDLSRRIELPQKKDEIYKLAQTVNSLMNRLEDAVLREKQFTADASHELRTPLSVIKGTLEVLIRKPREAEHYQTKIQYCIKEVDRIAGLIDQLLMLARQESSQIEIEAVVIELSKNTRYSIFRIGEYASDRDIKINFGAKDKYFVKADPALFDIIMENLFSNAIKYSGHSKEIDVIISGTESEVTCSIRDYGIGMNKDQLSRVFDRFYRSEEARSTEAGGHGIGMAIVKRLADLQNIRVDYFSEPLKGTTVTLRFQREYPA